MPADPLAILVPLCSAWLSGSLIGLERSFHGRPAGFRTHALVCTSAALLMVATVHQQEWIGDLPIDAVRTDPTRMAQGIMTGIGFIGAGVIFKEGLSVHGLTTAASIFMTASLGVIFGIGYYVPGIAATLITLCVLGLFRILERHIPTQSVLKNELRFARSKVRSEDEVRRLLAEHGFVVTKIGYELQDEGQLFEYRMLIGTLDPANVARLADALREHEDIVEFTLAPMVS